MTEYLTLEDILILVDELAVGPIRDVGLIDSAAHRPRTQLWGTDGYADIDTKAAALLQSLVSNHGLADGNKRLGWLSVVVFYAINGLDLDAPDDDAYHFVMSIADGTLVDLDDIAGPMQTWSRPLPT